LHLRRALLLFAIVLGLAALATAVSQPPRREARQQPAPQARTAPAGRPAEGRPPPRLRLSEAGPPKTSRLVSGRPAELVVEVDRPGLVEVEGLGLSADANPLTPARFDLLVRRPGRYRVELVPAGSSERKRVGVVHVAPL
jgi:hypothetical protein